MTFDEIAEQQGWNNDTIIDLLRRYIANQGDDAALDDFAQRQADEENEKDFAWPTLYEMHPIGVGGDLNATTPHHFCGEACRKLWRRDVNTEYSEGKEPSTVDDEVCEHCGCALYDTDKV